MGRHTLGHWQVQDWHSCWAASHNGRSRCLWSIRFQGPAINGRCSGQFRLRPRPSLRSDVSEYHAEQSNAKASATIILRQMGDMASIPMGLELKSYSRAIIEYVLCRNCD